MILRRKKRRGTFLSSLPGPEERGPGGVNLPRRGHPPARGLAAPPSRPRLPLLSQQPLPPQLCAGHPGSPRRCTPRPAGRAPSLHPIPYPIPSEGLCLGSPRPSPSLLPCLFFFFYSLSFFPSPPPPGKTRRLPPAPCSVAAGARRRRSGDTGAAWMWPLPPGRGSALPGTRRDGLGGLRSRGSTARRWPRARCEARRRGRCLRFCVTVPSRWVSF